MGLKRRKLAKGDRPLFTRTDAWLLAELPVSAAVATFVPERKWGAVALRLEKIKAALGRFSPDAIREGLALQGIKTADAAFRVAATRSEHHLQILRDFLWGWSAPVELIGAERVATALEQGHGAVLWVAHFSFNALAAKRALRDAGFAVFHLSRPEHGFSKSRFGIAVFNPIRVRAELRYLKGRIVIDRENPGYAIRHARRVLSENGIVSITAGAWEGGRLATVKVAGSELDLATGAPGLALMTGASLLPVFTVRDEGGLTVRVIVEPPIRLPTGEKREAALSAMSEEFGRRMTPYVKAYPLQWRDWEKIRPGSERATAGAR